ncbi:MAG TPA: sigma factor-like helix-turn-helix DNA-binding protein [Polyangia bacterium]
MASRARSGGLAEVLRAHVPAAAAVAREALEARLAELIAAARAAWPGLAVAPAEFVRHLGERLGEQPDVLAALRSWHTADLYLACGCAAGDPAALAAFERRILPGVASALARAGVTGALADEVLQAVRVRLFATGEGGARIAAYSGRVPLLPWVRLTATRQAVNLRRRRKTHGEPQPDAELEQRAAGGDPELGYLKARYAPELSAAFQAALATLSSRERNVLRQRFVHGLNIQQIGLLHHTHRATVARWIGHARTVLLAETRRILGARLRLDPGELDSLMGLARSRMDVTLGTALGSQP